MAPFLTEHSSGLLLAVKVQPRASKNELAGLLGAELKIRLTAPPVDSAANEALVEFLADLLGLHRKNVQLVKGQASRHKTILLLGASAARIEQALRACKKLTE